MPSCMRLSDHRSSPKPAELAWLVPSLLFDVVGYDVITSTNIIGTVAGGIILYAVYIPHSSLSPLYHTVLVLYSSAFLFFSIPPFNVRVLSLSLGCYLSAQTNPTSLIPAAIEARSSSHKSSWPLNNPKMVRASPPSPTLLTRSWVRKLARVFVVERDGVGAQHFRHPYPAALSLLIKTLLCAEREAYRLSLAPSRSPPSHAHFEGSLVQRSRITANRVDVVGILLIGASTALILLPITLSEAAMGGWYNASMIAMITVGCVLIPTYVFYVFKLASHPVVASWFVFNLGVIIVRLVGASDFLLLHLVHVPLQCRLRRQALMPAQPQPQLLLADTDRRTHFPTLVVAPAIRVLGCNLKIHSRAPMASDVEIVFSEVHHPGHRWRLSRFRSPRRPPSRTRTSPSLVLLITEIGGAIGTALSGGVWLHMMPTLMAHYLLFLSDANPVPLYGSIYGAAQFPRGHAVRKGFVLAYDDVVKIITIVATVFGPVPLVISL
ncbi:hypothetical protein D9619_005116 [Psilocybe cf. subviscida]|uniref:Uncharacterized protein n=1 Tax=Psilocybe cf. subviscida TaxID=2480587 RepID=A0A8H5BSA2_9AGAR|nr:hypothetical protein D9619_005116 [Psilocybe cf. subviscida]